MIVKDVRLAFIFKKWAADFDNLGMPHEAALWQLASYCFSTGRAMPAEQFKIVCEDVEFNNGLPALNKEIERENAHVYNKFVKYGLLSRFY